MTRTLILLPNQLFYRLLDGWTAAFNQAILVEHPKFFRGVHRMKLLYHRATMKLFFAALQERLPARYVNCRDYRRSSLPKDITLYHPMDHELLQEFAGAVLDECPLFPIPLAELERFRKLTSIRHNAQFYPWIKKQPFMRPVAGLIGSKVYDSENRKPFPKTLDPAAADPLPDYAADRSAAVQEAVRYVAELEKYLGSDRTWGALDEACCVFPLDRTQALEHLRNFVQTKLQDFGPYQDAIHSDVLIGFHSGLSAALNCGILSTEECLEAVASRKPRAAVQSVEAFVRQIASWRCYTMTLYLLHRDRFNERQFRHTRSIPRSFYTGTTGIAPLDEAIHKAYQYAYLHHIERLMVVGNTMFLCGFDPDEVFRWFMLCVSIDAYEWVMVPNIYGMSQHCTAFMMTRPYFSSSNYLLKMSNHTRARSTTWAPTFDSLYYHFVHRNLAMLEKSYVGSTAAAAWKKKSPSDQKSFTELASRFLRSGKVPVARAQPAS